MSTDRTHTPTTFALHVGETYRFNFAGMPSGEGIFLGWTSFGYIVLDMGGDDMGGDDGINFYNPALLCTIRPETYPPEA
jgi:hypothetical protein